jgi:hypothetical protein
MLSDHVAIPARPFGRRAQMTAMKKSTVVIALLCVLGLVHTTASARKMQVYKATTGANATKRPGTPGHKWQAVEDSAAITLNPGDVIYFACIDTADVTRDKFFMLSVIQAAPDQNVWNLEDQYVSGFKGDDSSSGEVGEEKDTRKSRYSAARNDWAYHFFKQPAWERVRVKNTGGYSISFMVEAYATSCYSGSGQGSYRWRVDRISIGVGADSAMTGVQRITKVMLFPEAYAVDTLVAPSFNGPPGSGNWTYQFVHDDPWYPRPLGGVRWTTDGAGIGAGVTFDMELSMVGGVDTYYTLYGYDAEVYEYDTICGLDYGSSVPTMSYRGLVVLLFLMLVTSAGLYLRRRTRRAKA